VAVYESVRNRIAVLEEEEVHEEQEERQYGAQQQFSINYPGADSPSMQRKRLRRLSKACRRMQYRRNMWNWYVVCFMDTPSLQTQRRSSQTINASNEITRKRSRN
jgi:hypothetical protein